MNWQFFIGFYISLTEETVITQAASRASACRRPQGRLFGWRVQRPTGVSGLGFRVQGLRLKVSRSGFRV